MQDLIDKLNSEIFKNPQNYKRPPSEYLEIYNSFTEKLHELQVKKQQLDQMIKSNKNESENESNRNKNMIKYDGKHLKVTIVALFLLIN